MKGRWAKGLTFVLLLSLVVSAVGHEHVGGREHAVEACVVDHARGHEAPALATIPQLTAAGERHDHQCLGCRLGGQRITLAPSGDGLGLPVVVRSAFVPDSVAHLRRPIINHTSRGPPIV